MAQRPDGNRRRIFLALMAFLANLYLIGFAADAGLSAIEEALRAATDSQALSMVRNILATIIFLASIIVLVILLFVPHLPKLVLLPPVIFALWASFGAPPYFPTQEDAGLMANLVMGQVALAAAAFLIIKVRTGHWFLASSRLAS